MILYTKKIDISYNLLYPLLGFKKNPLYKIKPSGVYCYWKEYAIEDNYLIVQYSEMSEACERDILQNPYLIGCFENNIYVFTVIHFTKDVLLIVKGGYSEISESTKRIIFSYHNIIDNKRPLAHRPLYQILRPDLYYSIIAEELNISLDILPKELFRKLNKKEETLKN